jgi:hypothetical protein
MSAAIATPSAPAAWSAFPSTSNPAPAAAHVPMWMPNSIGQSRRSSVIKLGPAASCQTLVTNDGTTSNAAASAGGMTRPSKPMATVGRPRPMTPLTKPAIRNAMRLSREWGSSAEQAMTGRTFQRLGTEDEVGFAPGRNRDRWFKPQC